MFFSTTLEFPTLLAAPFQTKAMTCNWQQTASGRTFSRNCFYQY
jgi:hypothetical protein